MATVNGLRLDDRLISFDFSPSIGINARQVDKFGMDIRSFREPLRRSIQQVMIPSFHKNFQAEGRPAWAPLAASTVETRGSAHPILQRSGRLRRRITQLARWDITNTAASIKDLPGDISYGAFHQGGVAGLEVGTLTEERDNISGARMTKLSTIGAIPQRQFVMIQDTDAAAIHEVFGNWLDERAAAAGINLRGG